MKKPVARKVQPKPQIIKYLSCGDSIQDIIDAAAAMGITDLKLIKFDQSYVGCSADHGDNYCYCSASYENQRFEVLL